MDSEIQSWVSCERQWTLIAWRGVAHIWAPQVNVELKHNIESLQQQSTWIWLLQGLLVPAKEVLKQSLRYGLPDLRVGGKLLRGDGQSKRTRILAISEIEAPRFRSCLEALPCKNNSYHSTGLEPHPAPICLWNWKAWLPPVPSSCNLKLLRSFIRMCS